MENVAPTSKHFIGHNNSDVVMTKQGEKWFNLNLCDGLSKYSIIASPLDKNILRMPEKNYLYGFGDRTVFHYDGVDYVSSENPYHVTKMVLDGLTYVTPVHGVTYVDTKDRNVSVKDIVNSFDVSANCKIDTSLYQLIKAVKRGDFVGDKNHDITKIDAVTILGSKIGKCVLCLHNNVWQIIHRITSAQVVRYRLQDLT